MNITAKHLLPGPHPVELGHDVPAAVPDDIAAELRGQLALLVGAVAFADGVLHSEWKVDGPAATLIECAGRTPGDSIVPLIGWAYGFDPYLALIDLLVGAEALAIPVCSTGGAAIRFLPAVPGRFVEVSGVAAARVCEGVVDVTVLAESGTSFSSVTSSWDRVAQVIAVGRDVGEARTRAEAAIGHLYVASEPEPAASVRPRP